MEDDPRSDAVEQTLAHSEVHRIWEEAYYGRASARYYECAFDVIVRCLDAQPGALILDAGCGPGHHAIRLAKRGYQVEAVDYSQAVLEVARDNIKLSGVEHAVRLRRENLVDLSFPDDSFGQVLCWGVLMHIPQVEQAIAELSRVLKPGGVAIVSEGNCHSLDAVAFRLLKRALAKKTMSMSRPSGTEIWEETTAGPLMIRKVDVGWLIRAFESNGLQLERRRAGEFTEAYTKFNAALITKAIDRFNVFWFSAIKNPRVAAGNILFLRKRLSSS